MSTGDHSEYVAFVRRAVRALARRVGGASLPTEHQPGAHRRMLTYVRTDVDVPLAVAS